MEDTKHKCLECENIHKEINEKVLPNGRLLMWCNNCQNYKDYSRV